MRMAVLGAGAMGGIVAAGLRRGGHDVLIIDPWKPHVEAIRTTGLRVTMTPSHPGEFIRAEILDELGLSVTRAAVVLGVRRATLSALLNGNAALSPEMALRVEKAFGVSMDLLLRMQAWHDAARMRARESEVAVQRYEPA